MTMQEAVTPAADISGGEMLHLSRYSYVRGYEPGDQAPLDQKGGPRNVSRIKSFFNVLKEEMEGNDIRGFDIWNAEEGVREWHRVAIDDSR